MIYLFSFLFYLQFTFNIILYWFQVYSILVRQSYSLQCVLPAISSTHLTTYIVTTILLTMFPMLCFTFLWPFCNCQFLLFNPYGAILKIVLSSFIFLFFYIIFCHWGRLKTATDSSMFLQSRVDSMLLSQEHRGFWDCLEHENMVKMRLCQELAQSFKNWQLPLSVSWSTWSWDATITSQVSPSSLIERLMWRKTDPQQTVSTEPQRTVGTNLPASPASGPSWK